MSTHLLIYANILLYIYTCLSLQMCTLICGIWDMNSCKKVYVHVILCSTILWNHTGIILYIYTYVFTFTSYVCYIVASHYMFLMMYFCSCILHVRVCTFAFLVFMHIYVLLYLHQVFFNTIVVFLYTYMCIYILYIHIFVDIYRYIICMCIYLKNVSHLCL